MITAIAQAWLSPHSTVQARPGGQTTFFPLHWPVHEMVQTPPAHPPVHMGEHMPPAGIFATSQPLDEEDALDEEDTPDEEDALDEEDTPDDDALELVDVLAAPPAPASLATGSSCTPKTSAHAGAASAGSASAANTTLG